MATTNSVTVGNPHRKHLISYLALAFVSTFFALAEWRGLQLKHLVSYDYAFSFTAFLSVLHHHTDWVNIYNMKSQIAFMRAHHLPIDVHNQYVYPPLFAWLFAPLGSLPFQTSAIVWSIGSALAFAAGLYLLGKLLWSDVKLLYFLPVVLLSGLLQPVVMDIAVGNVNSVLFFCIVLTFYLLHSRKSPGLAALALTLAILIKVTPAAILLVYVMRREWKFCLSTAAYVVIGFALSVLTVGWSTTVAYVTHFTSLGMTSMGNGPAPYNQSLLGVLEMFVAHGWMHLGTPALHTVMEVADFVWLLVIAGVAMRRHLDWRVGLALASLSPLLFSPLLEQMHMVLAIPALAVAARFAWERRLSRRASAAPSAYWLFVVTSIAFLCMSLPMTFVLNKIVYAQPTLFFVQSQMFVAVVLIFLTIVLLALGKAAGNCPVNSNSLRNTHPDSVADR